MSSVGGTQSPPLEATNSQGTLGAGSVSGETKSRPVDDSKQREQYFEQGGDQSKSTESKADKAPNSDK